MFGHLSRKVVQNLRKLHKTPVIQADCHFTVKQKPNISLIQQSMQWTVPVHQNQSRFSSVHVLIIVIVPLLSKSVCGKQIESASSACSPIHSDEASQRSSLTYVFLWQKLGSQTKLPNKVPAKHKVWVESGMQGKLQLVKCWENVQGSLYFSCWTKA